MTEQKTVTFESLCPEWANIIRKCSMREIRKFYSSEHNEFTGLPDPKFDLNHGDRCVVGEAYGLKFFDDDSYDPCGVCAYHALQIYESKNKRQLQSRINRFINHINCMENDNCTGRFRDRLMERIERCAV